mmetsp:Transcript_37579/g.79665  ORF Transcript_37579/g.79665 Transcript_37579/m.79665 type:complete len:121 (-) Transcript_37579:1056-1418(-)
MKTHENTRKHRLEEQSVKNKQLAQGPELRRRRTREYGGKALVLQATGVTGKTTNTCEGLRPRDTQDGWEHQCISLHGQQCKVCIQHAVHAKNEFQAVSNSALGVATRACMLMALPRLLLI